MSLLRKKARKPDRLKPADYEKLGRDFEDILIKDYIDVLHSAPRQIWSGFTRGVFTGLGGVIGATLGVALLLFILNLLGEVPFVDAIAKNISETIKDAR